MSRKILPHGDWVTLLGLPADTTEEDIQGLYHTRTGLFLPNEHIQLNDPDFERDRTSAIISLNRFQIKELLEWLFGQDSIGGRPIKLAIPDSRVKGGHL